METFILQFQTTIITSPFSRVKERVTIPQNVLCTSVQSLYSNTNKVYKKITNNNLESMFVTFRFSKCTLTISLPRSKCKFSPPFSHMLLIVQVLRVWCYMKQYRLVDIFFLLVTFLLKMRGYFEEKFLVGHIWKWNG